jgi:hypothetical protein
MKFTTKAMPIKLPIVRIRGDEQSLQGGASIGPIIMHPINDRKGPLPQHLFNSIPSGNHRGGLYPLGWLFD